MPKPKSTRTDLSTLPGHYIRRLQQIAVAIFLEEAKELAVTPVQYAALQAVHLQSGLDQRRLAASIGLDTSTTAGVIDRLENRELVIRTASPDDKRVRLLKLSSDGEKVLSKITPLMLQAQKRILAPLSKTDQKLFMAMLKQLVETNNELSRAPSEVI